MLKNIVILMIFASTRLFAQDLEAKVNELVKPLIDGGKNTGMVIGVYEIDNPYPRNFFFGKVSKEENKTPDQNTIYEIGSVTKTFTATMLMLLDREGKMKISDPAQNYLPDSVTLHIFSSNEPVKIMHLVTHTSSLPRLPGNLMNSSKADVKDPYANYSLGDLYSFLNNFIPEREPGTRYQYSNLGMGLLGELMARTTGMNYEEMLKSYITDSLGMTSTGITLSSEMKKNLAKGYTEKGEPAKNWNFMTLQGAGAIRSSLADMLKYLAFNMGKTETLNFGEGLTIMQKRRFDTDMDNTYIGMGWHISETGNGKEVIWHNGGTGGYSSFIGFIPELQSGVVVLSNQASSVDGVGLEILKYLNK